MQPNVHAVILAGGKSSRMGVAKDQLPWREGTLVTELGTEILAMGMPCLIVCNEPERIPAELVKRDGVSVTADLVPSAGPVSGLVTAFRLCRKDVLLVLSCDLPFMDRTQLASLLAYAAGKDGWDAVIPSAQGRIHPLCALYRKSTQPVWEQALEQGELRLMNTIRKLSVLEVPDGWLDPWALFNANTPEEYAAAIREEQRRKTGRP
ncbi:putative molybdenum cofactor guanylyltransferase [Brevibacillus agri]|uniref:Probable molybdenum cofactor guanylyltransferase n=1 Tax=Brevibacillus agri TaxID=51101 RepID=A0A3M8ACN1_9BACL|nr:MULTISPECIES: molybdenum cofactor guanylyltransferase [Brevibacillus]EJL44242.1 molybdopterin-guanine dinucleotide biosynthesis protein A [Brevibacillus sp. CF112]MBG9563985.1 molybdopterin-guanine dinucleotide biosynthesis protein MobA [Brevibacillus agri]MCG5253489.1 molybdenum cofactor guanylyltransferase [Brevibacillus agri]MDR9504181.1 molybdenum cofactor guanylyltransferase [Brevibacillus agri]MED1643277.1 molybdenum cofactor guanylyltransferase [Brevibacillus agri]